MRPQLYCDIDSTINNHWVRIQRNTVNGVIQPSAWTEEEVMQDEPLIGAVAALNKFATDFDVNFLSSRNWPGSKPMTEQWLRKHCFPFKSVNIVDSHHAKVPFLRDHHCDLYIDDFTGGQEFRGPPFPIIYHDIMAAMPCAYEQFLTHIPTYWDTIVAKYYELIPNGEFFWQLMIRNLNWWRGSRDFEAVSRARYYDNFANAIGLTRDYLNDKVVAEVGAGPFGGLIRHLNPNTTKEIYIDILASAQRTLGFITWPANSSFVDCPVENISKLTSKSVDVLLSYNAIDHGSDVISGLDEIARVSKEFFIAFDCKADTAPMHDRVDHYQIVEFNKVAAHMSKLAAEGAVKIVSMGNLCQKTPTFYFEHNWGFPVFYCLAKTV